MARIGSRFTTSLERSDVWKKMSPAVLIALCCAVGTTAGENATEEAASCMFDSFYAIDAERGQSQALATVSFVGMDERSRRETVIKFAKLLNVTPGPHLHTRTRVALLLPLPASNGLTGCPLNSVSHLHGRLTRTLGKSVYCIISCLGFGTDKSSAVFGTYFVPTVVSHQ